MSDIVHVARSAYALACKHHGRGSTQAAETRTALQYSKLERYTAEIVAAATNPSAEQVERIVGILQGGALR